MYSIYCDGKVLYSDISPLENVKILEPKLTLEDNAAGSLEIKVPVINDCYDSIYLMKSEIIVKRNGKEIWAGRPISQDIDFYNNKVIYCEGELAYLNDICMTPRTFSDKHITNYFNELLSYYNRHKTGSTNEDPKRYHFGSRWTDVDLYDETDTQVTSHTWEIKYETIMKLIDDLTSEYGGHLRLSKDENGNKHLDYLKDKSEHLHSNTQYIEWGKNLIDLTKKYDFTNYANVLIPIGKDGLTIKDYNNGSIYLEDKEAVKYYGRIEKKIEWSEITSRSMLLNRAQKYLADLQLDDIEIELSAYDLSMLNVDVESINLLDNISILSMPHYMTSLQKADQYTITKIEIPLDEPENASYTLGNPRASSISHRTKASVQSR